MSKEEEEFQSVDFVIDNDYIPTNEPVVKQDAKKPESLSISTIMSNRNGEPPSVEAMQDMQNRLMGRHPNFSKLSNAEKEEILFKEIQDWHFANMPPIETLRKEVNKNGIPITVDTTDDPAALRGVGAPHINILAENVRLAIVSDGKTITFNNKELLEEYRNKINEKNNMPTESKIPKIQDIGSVAHDEREFE